MTTKSFKLTDDDERKLGEIMAAMQMHDFSKVMRKLITDQWLALQAGRTFVERRGGHPEHLLYGASDLSSRAKRKEQVAEHIRSTVKRRKGTQ